MSGQHNIWPDMDLFQCPVSGGYIPLCTETRLSLLLVKKPEATLRDYSDSTIPVVACVELRLSAEAKQIREVVYIMHDAKLKGLIGGINTVRGLGLDPLPRL